MMDISHVSTPIETAMLIVSAIPIVIAFIIVIYLWCKPYLKSSKEEKQWCVKKNR